MQWYFSMHRIKSPNELELHFFQLLFPYPVIYHTKKINLDHEFMMDNICWHIMLNFCQELVAQLTLHGVFNRDVQDSNPPSNYWFIHTKKKVFNSKFFLQTLVDTAMLETDVDDDVG